MLKKALCLVLNKKYTSYDFVACRINIFCYHRNDRIRHAL